MGGAEGRGATLDYCDLVGAAESEHVETAVSGLCRVGEMLSTGRAGRTGSVPQKTCFCTSGGVGGGGGSEREEGDRGWVGQKRSGGGAVAPRRRSGRPGRG